MVALAARPPGPLAHVHPALGGHVARPGSARPRARAHATPTDGWWRYVDRARQHEVLANWRAPEGALVVREWSPAALDAAIEERQAIGAPWEARLALWLLEARLSQLGEYWRARSVAPGWARVGRPVNAPVLDARPSEVVDPAKVPAAHHYFDAHGDDTLVAALRADAAGRFVVVRARLDVMDLAVGRIDVVHPLLPAALVPSLVAREQLTLVRSGLPKLVTRADYERAFGRAGDQRAARLIESVATRVADGELARPAARRDDADEVYAEFLVTLCDPRLLALHHRFLVPGEEDEVLASGAAGIRRLLASKRASASHHEQHLLTILEASLLARERMRSGKLDRRDPEVRALTRLAYYL